MGHGDEFDVKRPLFEPPAKLDHMDRHLIGKIGFRQFGLQELGGKRGGIDRAFQPWPKIRHRAKVILMRMGQDKAKKFVFAFLDKGRIGHDNIDTGQTFLAKGNAHIDHQPLIVISVQIEVHANFARSPQRHKQQFVFRQIQIHG